eukprot:6476224-Amphidinium_carterae.1
MFKRRSAQKARKLEPTKLQKKRKDIIGGGTGWVSIAAVKRCFSLCAVESQRDFKNSIADSCSSRQLDDKGPL